MKIDGMYKLPENKKVVDEYNGKLGELQKKKESELMGA